MKYEPDYAKGQIIVEFKDNVSNDGFAESVGTLLGYKFLTEKDLYDEATNTYYDNPGYIFVTPEGKEEEAIKKFLSSKFGENIEWACRRDLKFERRNKSLEDILDLANNLCDSVEVPDNDLEKELKELVGYVNNFIVKLRKKEL